jgi:hypothetical protein
MKGDSSLSNIANLVVALTPAGRSTPRSDEGSEVISVQFKASHSVSKIRVHPRPRHRIIRKPAAEPVQMDLILVTAGTRIDKLIKRKGCCGIRQT